MRHSRRLPLLQLRRRDADFVIDTRLSVWEDRASIVIGTTSLSYTDRLAERCSHCGKPIQPITERFEVSVQIVARLRRVA